MTAQERYVIFQITGRRPRRAPRPARRGPRRDKRYLAWIRTQPSALSGLMGCEAAHTGTDGGMSQKASDYSCIPLTPAEHREYHRIGKRAFEEIYTIDCARVVEVLKARYGL